MPFAEKAAAQRTYKGRFTGANGADPTVYSLDPGVGVPVRTGEGVWTILLPSPVAGLKSAIVTCSDGGEFHELGWTFSTTTRKLTITHKTCAYADIVTGPAAEDVVAQIHFEVTVAESDCIGAGV